MSSAPQLLGNQIEILNQDIVRGRVRHVLFDFDGTLSLIREGWQQVMIPMMVETILDTGTDESAQAIEDAVREYVTRLTGKQTIYQMIELADQVRRRGKVPRDPLKYKHEYLRRLDQRIAQRIAGLTEGSIDPESLLVPGSRELLLGLQQRGLRLYLASGTDEPFVLREAQLLQLTEFFNGGIFGALDNYAAFSKQMVIDRIVRDHGLGGPELLGIGDGYVEIENTKSVGGIALGIPSLEADPVDYDLWKKGRLAEAGADVLAPHFREHELLLDYLCG